MAVLGADTVIAILYLRDEGGQSCGLVEEGRLESALKQVLLQLLVDV